MDISACACIGGSMYKKIYVVSMLASEVASAPRKVMRISLACSSYITTLRTSVLNDLVEDGDVNGAMLLAKKLLAFLLSDQGLLLTR